MSSPIPDVNSVNTSSNPDGMRRMPAPPNGHSRPAARTDAGDEGEGEVATVVVFAVLGVVLVAIITGGAFLMESVTGRSNSVWSIAVEQGYGSRVWRSTVYMPTTWATGAFQSCTTTNDPWLVGWAAEDGRPIYRDLNTPLDLSCNPAGNGQNAEMDVRFYGLVTNNRIKKLETLWWECRKTSSDTHPISCRPRRRP